MRRVDATLDDGRNAAPVSCEPTFEGYRADRWPSDYLTMDQGRLFVRRDYLAALQSQGWESCDAVMNAVNCTVIRQVEERDNCIVDLAHPAKGTVRAYLKRHWNRPLAATAETFEPPGIQEADAVGRCQAAGVRTMSIIAAGKQAGADGTVESFFLSEEIAGGQPADDFWKRRMGRPDARLSSTGRRLRLLNELAVAAGRFHRANLFHRDFYWCHFFVAEPRPGEYAVYLIDLQRVLRPSRFRWRWLLKDLAQFRFSVPDGYLTRDEIDYWFRCYRQGASASTMQRLGVAAIDVRAALYRWRERRR